MDQFITITTPVAQVLERLKRKESAVVRFGSEKLWSYTRAHQDPYSRNQDPYSMYRISDPTLFVRLYGSGKNSREWIHVQDHCEALLKIFLKGIQRVITIARPEKIAPATKYGGNIVVCHPGVFAMAKSQETTL